jgi:ribosomal protein S26
MGGNRRGRQKLETCSSCGRAVPRGKAVEYSSRTHFTTDLKEDNVTYTGFVDQYYCISCAKHRKIFEKKAEQAKRLREKRQLYG